MKNFLNLRNIFRPVTLFLIILSFLSTSSLSSASIELNKNTATLREEIKAAQAKLDKAKAGETLEKITIPVSIKNMQKILVSLNQKAGDIKNLAAPINNLNIGLKALEKATHNDDKPGARKALNDMTAALKALESETAKGDREKATSKPVTSGRLSSKVEDFLKNLEKIESLEELDRSAGNANFSRQELEELKTEIKKPPYSNKIKNLADKAKAPAKVKMEAKIQQIVTLKKQEFKKKQDDELNLLNQQARAKLKTAISNAQTRVRAEMERPPPAPPDTMVATRPVVKDPAKITSLIPQPLVIGAAFDQLHIIGENFGRSGRVTLSIGTKNTTLDTVAWRPDSIAVKMYSHLTEFFRDEALNAMRDGEIIGRLWVHAAKNVATSEVRIHTSGWNLTLTPQIATVSSDEIRPGQEITIEGRYFLSKTPGSEVKFIFGSRNIIGDILEWNDSVIHVRLRSDVSGISAMRGTVQVKNSLGFSGDKRIDFRPEYELQSLREVISEYRGSSWEETYTFWNFELINGWIVDSYSIDVIEGSIRPQETPRFGSTNPRTVVHATAQGGRAGLSGETWWVMAFFNLSIQGPRGTNYR